MEIEQLQQSAKSKSPLDKIVAENERLARDYKKEVAKTRQLQLSLSTLQIQHDKLAQEVERFNKSASRSVPRSVPVRPPPPISGEEQLHVGDGGHDELEVKVEWLQAELEKKTVMLMEVKRHLKEAAEREKEFKNISSEAQVLLHSGSGLQATPKSHLCNQTFATGLMWAVICIRIQGCVCRGGGGGPGSPNSYPFLRNLISNSV